MPSRDRELEIEIFAVPHKFVIVTRGNFSFIKGSYWINQGYIFSALFLVIFDAFEEKFGLKILSWEIREVTSHTKRELVVGEIEILVNHEPKEKAKVTHLLEAEPDIGL